MPQSEAAKEFDSFLLKFTAGETPYKSVQELADHLKQTPANISNKLRRLGFSRSKYIVSNTGVYLPKNDAEFWETVHRDYYVLSSLPLKEIATTLGISTTPLIAQFKKHGLKIKDPIEARFSPEALKKRSKTQKKLEETGQGSISKMRAFFKEKHGVDNPMQVDSIKQKNKDTLLKRYGVVHNSHIPEVKAQMEATNLERYGSTNPFGNKAIQDKIKATLQEKYGVDNPNQYFFFQQKRHSTYLSNKEVDVNIMLKKWDYELMEEFQGVTNPGYDNRSRLHKIKHTTCGHIFEDDLRRTPRCPQCFPLYGNHPSQQETAYANFIKNLGFTVDQGNRELIKNPLTNRFYELDIFLPDKMIAFEYNGLYYHSCGHIQKGRTKEVHKYYHRRKSQAALDHGIKLYHIWEHFPEGLVQSMISNVLGLSTSLAARKTVVDLIPGPQASKFLATYHLHGAVTAGLHIGLLYEGELVALLSFRKVSKGVVDNIRYCVKMGLSIPGAFARLMDKSRLILKSKGYHQLITFANRDWTPDPTTSVYAKNGFSLENQCRPSMWYTDFKGVYSRRSFQRKSIARKFPDTYDPDLSEAANLGLQGLFPIYNSGLWKYILPL